MLKLVSFFTNYVILLYSCLLSLCVVFVSGFLFISFVTIFCFLFLTPFFFFFVLVSFSYRVDFETPCVHYFDFKIFKFYLIFKNQIIIYLIILQLIFNNLN